MEISDDYVLWCVLAPKNSLSVCRWPPTREFESCQVKVREMGNVGESICVIACSILPCSEMEMQKIVNTSITNCSRI